MSQHAGATTVPRGRTLAYRIVAGVFGVLALVFSAPFAVASYTDAEQEPHLIHNLGGLAVYGVILGVGLLLATRPGSNVATFQGLALAAVGALVGGLLAGDLVEGLWLAPAAIVLILYALYPDRAARMRSGRPQVALLVLVFAAAVPLVGYALDQARLQSEGLVANPHVELHRYSGQAVAVLMLLLFAVAPGLGGLGWRIAAWLAGVAMAVIALASMTYGGYESALGVPVAWLSLAWALAFVAIAEVQSCRSRA